MQYTLHSRSTDFEPTPRTHTTHHRHEQTTKNFFIFFLLTCIYHLQNVKSGKYFPRYNYGTFYFLYNYGTFYFLSITFFSVRFPTTNFFLFIFKILLYVIILLSIYVCINIYFFF